jgi:hypothetical protein
MEELYAKLHDEFEKDDKWSNPKTKEELLKRYNNVFFHKTFINTEAFKFNADTKTQVKMVMISNCVIVMWEIEKYTFRIDVHLSEIVSMAPLGGVKKDAKMVKRGFELVGTLLTGKYSECKDVIEYGVPVWPDRKKSLKLHPTFKIVEPDEPRLRDILDKETYNYFEKKWIDTLRDESIVYL